MKKKKQQIKTKRNKSGLRASWAGPLDWPCKSHYISSAAARR